MSIRTMFNWIGYSCIGKMNLHCTCVTGLIEILKRSKSLEAMANRKLILLCTSVLKYFSVTILGGMLLSVCSPYFTSLGLNSAYGAPCLMLLLPLAKKAWGKVMFLLVSTYVVCERLSVMHEPAGLVEILVQNQGEYPLF